MITHKFEDHDQWMEYRRGKITGSRLSDVVSTKETVKKIGFYELIAERIGIPGDGEDPMDRGHRLEEDAIERFTESTGKVVDNSLIVWESSDNSSMAVSPDGIIGETEAVEVKCLSSARHIEAFMGAGVPKDFKYQVLQYFIVNEKLETLYLCFYDPRLKVKDFFFKTIDRSHLAGEIEEIKKYEQDMLSEVDGIVDSMMKF